MVDLHVHYTLLRHNLDTSKCFCKANQLKSKLNQGDLSDLDDTACMKKSNNQFKL